MKKIFYMLIFGLFCSFSSAQAMTQAAAERLCAQNIPPTRLKISFSPGKLHYYHSKGRRGLARMHKRDGGANPSTNGLNGLATHNTDFQFSFDIEQKQLKADVFCIYPTRIDFRILLKNPAIYVAKEIPADTCAHEITLRHEQTHQQINIENFTHYLPILRQRLIEIVSEHSLIGRTSGVDLTLAKESLKQRYKTELQPLLDEMKKNLATEQNKLDNQKQYDYEASLCPKKK